MFVPQKLFDDTSADSVVVSVVIAPEVVATPVSDGWVVDVFVQRFNSCRKSLKSSKYGQVIDNFTSNNFCLIDSQKFNFSGFMTNSAYANIASSFFSHFDRNHFSGQFSTHDSVSSFSHVKSSTTSINHQNHLVCSFSLI
ncbi:hypothetical protein IJL65_02400 [bacterium]|nr:hypothetical protein [bacterium]